MSVSILLGARILPRNEEKCNGRGKEGKNHAEMDSSWKYQYDFMLEILVLSVAKIKK